MIIYLNIQNRFYTKVQIVKKILNFLLILIESNTMANQYYQEKCFIYIYTCTGFFRDCTVSKKDSRYTSCVCTTVSLRNLLRLLKQILPINVL